MILARKFSGLSNQLIRNKIYLYSAARCYSDDRPSTWIHLWSPETYEKKNHDKIAEKYNLHPKDYKPYPSDERPVGDYPMLPMIGPAAKDPHYPYDIPAFKKNYCETLHDQFEIMSEDRFSYGYNYVIDLRLASVICILILFTCGAIAYLVEPYSSFSPVMEQQYVEKGKTHYTFEPAK